MAKAEEEARAAAASENEDHSDDGSDDDFDDEGEDEFADFPTVEEVAAAEAEVATAAAKAAAAKAAGGNPFGVREQSVLEKRYQAEAMARQKGNQIVKQVVGGKEWTGPPPRMSDLSENVPPTANTWKATGHWLVDRAGCA